MTIRDILRRKSKIEESTNLDHTVEPPQIPTANPNSQSKQSHEPEITFLRTTTNSEEVIVPPTDFTDEVSRQPISTSSTPEKSESKSKSFRRSFLGLSGRDAAATTDHDANPRRSLSQRLHFAPQAVSSSSTNIANELGLINGNVALDADAEARWEKRATLLAKVNSPAGGSHEDLNTTLQSETVKHIKRRSASPAISTKENDEKLQEAIRLHEDGDLETSTILFGQLADPHGANNALSQVLYGLALRHGWGIEKDEPSAVRYFQYAASSSADIETLALQAGSKKGGAAKGELTLAIFELANCFRHGLGVVKDPVAAKQYYETAANMGDLDAMNEVAWCYVEGFGCKKDKFKAAQYLRLAEERGSKVLGNSWIWKDKYGGPRKSS